MRNQLSAFFCQKSYEWITSYIGAPWRDFNEKIKIRKTNCCLKWPLCQSMAQDCANPQVANKSEIIMKKTLCLLVFSLNLALALAAPVRLDRGAAAEDPFVTKRNLTNAVRLVEGSNDANIAKVTVGILENGHYLKQPFNDEISAKFLDQFLNSLDNLHIYFLQSDLKEFEKYRTTLDDLTKEGGVRPSTTTSPIFTDSTRIPLTRFSAALTFWTHPSPFIPSIT